MPYYVIPALGIVAIICTLVISQSILLRMDKKEIERMDREGRYMASVNYMVGAVFRNGGIGMVSGFSILWLVIIIAGGQTSPAFYAFSALFMAPLTLTLFAIRGIRRRC